MMIICLVKFGQLLVQSGENRPSRDPAFASSAYLKREAGSKWPTEQNPKVGSPTSNRIITTTFVQECATLIGLVVAE
jgi:hypothetical protein